MENVVRAARIVLGLVFVVFSIDYVLHFMPDPGASERGGAFLEALFVTGYLFPVVKAIEFAGGVLLLWGRFVPLAAALLAPIVVNIALYHLFLDATNWWIALLVAVLEAFLLWAHRGAFAPLFAGRPRERRASDWVVGAEAAAGRAGRG
jgi:putative oxidoreductase